VAHAGENRHFVGFELHPRAASESQAAASKLGTDVVDGYGQPGWKSLENHNEGFAMGLTGSQVAQHPANLPVDSPTPEDS
jgi:hypothetical protein